MKEDFIFVIFHTFGLFFIDIGYDAIKTINQHYIILFKIEINT